jgi:hypothetical protein
MKLLTFSLPASSPFIGMVVPWIPDLAYLERHIRVGPSVLWRLHTIFLSCTLSDLETDISDFFLAIIAGSITDSWVPSKADHVVPFPY